MLDQFGGSDKEDVLSAYRLLESLPFVDTNAISVMGFSRGSINATLTVVEIEKVSKLISWSGTQDMQVDFSHGLNMYNKLQETGATVEFHKYEGYGHHFPQDIHKVAIKHMFQWINN